MVKKSAQEPSVCRQRVSVCSVQGRHVAQRTLFFPRQFLKSTGAFAIRLSISSYWNELISSHLQFSSKDILLRVVTLAVPLPPSIFVNPSAANANGILHGICPCAIKVE